MPFDQQRQDYFEALDWVTALMEATDPGQLTNATPCTEFDVRALMDHLIGTARRGLGTAEGVSLREIPHVVTDIPDARLAMAYGLLAEQIQIAWSRLRSGAQVRAPWGWCTAEHATCGFTIETITHGWDLAVATGQPAAKLEPVAERCLGFADDTIPSRLRGVMYDDPVREPAGTPATERLANFLGRQPQPGPNQPQGR